AAAGERILVGDALRATGAAAERQPAQPLPDQLADAAHAEARRRWRPDDLHPARIAGPGPRGQLAAGAQWADHGGLASVSAKVERAERQVEGAAAAEGGLRACRTSISRPSSRGARGTPAGRYARRRPRPSASWPRCSSSGASPRGPWRRPPPRPRA